MMDVALIGTGGMMPMPSRFLACLLVRTCGKMILFDCGEGTQVSLRMLGWGFKNIDIICITHFHGDHVTGIPGLLLTLANADRTEPLVMYGPIGLRRIVESLAIVAQDLPYEIVYNEVSAAGVCFADGLLKMSCLPLRHRTPCFAYSLELLRRGKFDPIRARELDIPIKLWSRLQKQTDESFVYEGRKYFSDMVLGTPRRGLKVVYCTDTRPVRGLKDFAHAADLFVCEGMHGAAENEAKTVSFMHMTFKEAAAIARDANVGSLWLTHFSPAMPDPHLYLRSATSIFPQAVVGRDRMNITLSYDKE